MKLALLSDIHGNSIALDAVLADIRAQGGVDQYILIGDYVAMGPDPAGVMALLDTLPNIVYVRGNTDKYTAFEELPAPMVEDVKADLSKLPKLIEVARSFAYTRGAMAAINKLDWLRALPIEYRLTLPDGTRLLAVHAAPGTDDGTGIHPRLTDAQWEQTLVDCNADLVCVGHTHTPMNVQIGPIHVVNLGSISNQVAIDTPPDLRASYVMIIADEQGHTVQHRRVDYDHEVVIAQLQACGHPAADFIAGFMRGQVAPPWKR